MKDNFLSTAWRGLVVWIFIICAEFLHGTARVIFLQPLVGDFRARQITVFTGILLILTISYFLVGWLRTANNLHLFAVGLLWLVLTIAFEISLGRAMNFSWERIFSDYNISSGGLMPIGLLFLTLSPFIAAKLKRKLSRKQIIESS